MKSFILLTGIGELLVGLVMLFNPTLIPQFPKKFALALATARMYGAAAISIGVFAILVAMNFDQTALHQSFLIVYLTFHALVALSIFIAVQANEPANAKIGILHAILAVATAYFLFF